MVLGADIENDVIVALITGATTVLVVTLPLYIQNRQTNRAVRETSKQVNELHEQLNGHSPPEQP